MSNNLPDPVRDIGKVWAWMKAGIEFSVATRTYSARACGDEIMVHHKENGQGEEDYVMCDVMVGEFETLINMITDEDWWRMACEYIAIKKELN